IRRFIHHVPALYASLVAFGQFLHMLLEVLFHQSPFLRHPGRMSPGAHAINDGMSVHVDASRFAEINHRICGWAPIFVGTTLPVSRFTLFLLQCSPVKGNGGSIEQGAEGLLVATVLLRRTTISL